MSFVTNVLLTWGPGEEDAIRLAEVNAAYPDAVPALVSVDDPVIGPDWYGGTKYLECGIALGALNYLRLADLVAAVNGAAWAQPDGVQLWIRDEEMSGFDCVPLHGPLPDSYQPAAWRPGPPPLP